MGLGNAFYTNINELAIDPLGDHQSIAAGGVNSAVNLNTRNPGGKPEGATKLLIQALDQNIRFTIDGRTTPTASKGMRLAAGFERLIILRPSVVIIVIAETAGASLQYQWGV